MMLRKKKLALLLIYIIATVQFVWCYLWLTRPYVNTFLYEWGLERMPFQGRMLMMLPMRLAHSSFGLTWLASGFKVSHFWFPRPVAPEVIVQAIIDVVCLLIAGWMTTKLYAASSRHRLLTYAIYPVFLVACAATYVMHTVQNFRFLYDLPSLAFFATAMDLIYARKHWIWFAALFLIATINRETTLLLLPLYMLDGAVEHGHFMWKRLFKRRSLMVAIPLAILWSGWQIYIRYFFADNDSEFYPRLAWNIKSLLIPQAWPQLLSASAYLMLFVVVLRHRITDRRLRTWLWILPIWLTFMFVYGILIETRVFGELIPFIVCSAALILEQMLMEKVNALRPERTVARVEPININKAA